MRRRRQFQRHRRPGERMPASSAGAQQVERAARDAGREPGLDLLDRALVQLAEEAQAGGHALPDVRLVRVSAESVVLDLAAPASSAISPFVSADDTRWVLSPALLASELPDRPRALAGLVTLGFAGPETVLLNLESVGTLAVTRVGRRHRGRAPRPRCGAGLRTVQRPDRAHPVPGRPSDRRGRRGRWHRGRGRSGARGGHAGRRPGHVHRDGIRRWRPAADRRSATMSSTSESRPDPDARSSPRHPSPAPARPWSSTTQGWLCCCRSVSTSFRSA